METKTLRFTASNSTGEVSAVLMRPSGMKWLLVLGHGAGAGMHHPFMQALAHRLAVCGIATLRYQFPFMEQGKRAPNPQPILMKSVRSAVAVAADYAAGVTLLAGGKSLGGRMTSNAAAREPLPGVAGIVFFGFPLHAPAKPSQHRADHLFNVAVPMLFLQGTRDKLADLSLLRPVCDKLARRATLHTIEWADHGFHVPKKSGTSDENVIAELAQTTLNWAEGIT